LTNTTRKSVRQSNERQLKNTSIIQSSLLYTFCRRYSFQRFSTHFSEKVRRLRVSINYLSRSICPNLANRQLLETCDLAIFTGSQITYAACCSLLPYISNRANQQHSANNATMNAYPSHGNPAREGPFQLDLGRRDEPYRLSWVRLSTLPTIPIYSMRTQRMLHLLLSKVGLKLGGFLFVFAVVKFSVP
jgi:hypothetical protein